MIDFVKDIIVKAGVNAGVPNEHILLELSNNIITPKPAISIQFLEETFTKTGYSLANFIDKQKKEMEHIISLYEVRLPIICNIYADNNEEINAISNAFIKGLPRKIADKNNNIVKIKATSSNWEIVGGSTIGLKRVEPIIKRQRLVKIDVYYHISDSTIIALMDNVNIKGAIK